MFNIFCTGQAMLKGNRIEAGDRLAPMSVLDIHGRHVAIPDSQCLIHLQFRRFAGCPVCDLHLQSIVRRLRELSAEAIGEVVVFHSSVQDLLPYAADLPFAVVADPEKRLYAKFGVESGGRALLDPRAWLPIGRGVLRSIGRIVRGRQPLPPLNPKGGSLGLPADFLIASDGSVLACKYGEHAFDQWPVDEILTLSRSSQRTGT
ncbi:MAG TPA: AhpC/TSA family protein [Bryobacteraceae bacterium]|nr:AhpC/TSA family protein [Bryobacteraceae bacterium]